MNRDEATRILHSAVAGLELVRDVANSLEPRDDVDRAIESLFDGPERPAQEPIEVSRSAFTIAEAMVQLTTDDNATDVMRRALGLYRAIVLHVKSGGQVLFVNGAESRTLKVALRP